MTKWSNARQRSIVVFLGPSLARTEAQTLLDAIYLPSASQGSVVAAVNRYNPDAILIIDGTFQDVPAVRHKEILWALGEGIPVVGAASMGALRAAELHPYMHGVGLIYRWYRRFQFTPDDAVAVLHGPSEVNDSAITVAEVDLRMTIRVLAHSKLVSGRERSQLCEIARKLNFRDRTVERVSEQAALVTPDRTPAEWTKLFSEMLVEQKKHDTREALGLMAQGAFDTVAAPVEFQATAAFMEDLSQLVSLS